MLSRWLEPPSGNISKLSIMMASIPPISHRASVMNFVKPMNWSLQPLPIVKCQEMIFSTIACECLISPMVNACT